MRVQLDLSCAARLRQVHCPVGCTKHARARRGRWHCTGRPRARTGAVEDKVIVRAVAVQLLLQPL
jgi:hypothetical protein